MKDRTCYNCERFPICGLWKSWATLYSNWAHMLDLPLDDKPGDWIGRMCRYWEQLKDGTGTCPSESYSSSAR